MIEGTISAKNAQAVGAVAGLCLLVTRGILLWIVIPLGFVAWVAQTPWLRPRRITLGQFLGWLDINLIALLERSVLRPLFREQPQSWIPRRDIQKVAHRVGGLSLL